MTIALFLGAGLGADAFFVAFRIPNLLRRLFGEGALSAAFVPTFVDTLQKGGHDEANKLARVTFTVAALILLGVTILGIAFSPAVVKLIAPGFADDPTKFGLTVSLNRIMFPYIFFISLVALAMGVLNSFGYFAAPAAAPVLLNISMITSVSVFCTFFNAHPTYALAGGVVVSGLLQLLLQLPFMRAAGIRLRPDFNFRNPALKRIGILFVPAAFGGAVYQLNVLIGTILASLLPAGGVSWLYYADRLVELPLGVFAIALGTAVLPTMSRQASRNDTQGLVESVSYALRLIGFFTIPASVGLILLREPIIAVLFQRGLFTYEDTLQSAYALLYYTAGLWAFSALKVITQAFFSLKDTKTPVYAAVVAVVVNLVGGLILMGPLRHGGLALAVSLAAACNVSVLFWILIRRLGVFPTRTFLASIGRIIAASLAIAPLLVYCDAQGDWALGLTLRNGLLLAGAILGGLGLFVGAAFLLGCPELRSMVGIVRRRATV